MRKRTLEYTRGKTVLTDQLVADLGLWTNLRRLDHRTRHFLGRTETRGRNILEIGCGNGAFLIWCWIQGAAGCVGLEPEEDGSTSGVASVFENAIRVLNCQDEVQLLRCRFEDLPDDGAQSYDLVLLYNVVNHLDEVACARLHDEPEARQIYIDVFMNLGQHLKAGGKIIIADCARSNLFHDLGMKNPLAPNIEWTKHQNPGVWKAVLRAAGYHPCALRWYRLYPMRHLGNLFSNRLFAYLTYSHFVLEATKP